MKRGPQQVDVSESALLAALDVDAPLPAESARTGRPIADRQTGSGSDDAPVQQGWVKVVRRVAVATRQAIVEEWERGGAFLLVPVLMAAGAMVYFSSRVEPGLAPLAAGATLLGALTFLTRARLAAHMAFAAMLLVLLGMVFAKIETMRAGTKVIGADISTVLTGRVAVIEHQANGRVRLTIDVTRTDRPTLRYAPDRVRVSARAVPDGLVAGSEVAGVVRLFPPTGPVRPQSYDFSFESYFDGIGANGFFLKNPEIVIAPRLPGLGDIALAWVENTRTDLASRIRDRIGGPEGEIAAALVAGVRAGIPEDVNEALRRTGLAHILSISGLHMALVAATIMGVMRLCFAFFPEFASRRPVKKYAAIVALVAIALYLFISGSAVAAERSFVMLAVMLVALMFDRSALTMRNLAIAAIAVVVLSPHEVVGPSFQMSFAATAALIGAYAAWSRYREKRPTAGPASHAQAAWPRRIARTTLLYAAGLAATSLVAGLATTPYGAWHFQRVSPLSLFANLAAMPIVSVSVMPFALFAVAAMPFGLDGPFLDVMGKGIAAMIAVAEWFSARSPVDAVGAIPVGSVVAFTIALAAATLATTRLRLAALPFALAGAVMLADRDLPDMLIAEDGRLVALGMDDGRIAINRGRPNSFTSENWQRAMQADIVSKPTKGALLVSPAEAGGIVERGMSGDGFYCEDGLCLARHPGGTIVAHAASADVAARACETAGLIVIEDASAESPCPPSVAVITGRDLARRGSVAITFPGSGANPAAAGPPAISFALTEPYRPWHAHRQFTRAARGLPAYKPRERLPAKTATGDPAE